MIRGKYFLVLSVCITFSSIQCVSLLDYIKKSISILRHIADYEKSETIELTNVESPAIETEDLALPDLFQEFQNINIRHIKSTRQEGGSCGWYAVCNAVAIDQLVAASKEVEGVAIRKIVEQTLVPSLKAESDALVQRFEIQKFFEGITHKSSYRLSQHLHLSNYYAVDLFPKKRWFQLYLPTLSNELSPYVDPSKKYCDIYYVKSHKQFFSKIFSAKKVFHFDVSIPTKFDLDSYHAVLVTVIPAGESSKPTVIYMNSNNTPLDKNHTWLLFPALYLFFKAMNDALA